MKKLSDAQNIAEELLLKNYQRYYRLAYSYVKNEQDALDVVQESAYKAIKKCQKIKEASYMETWIYRVVINTALDFLRRSNRETPTPDAWEVQYQDEYADIDLMKAMYQLEEKERAVVVLRFFEDRKLEEIAEITEENVNTVKSRMYRALKKLKVHLSEEEERSAGL